MPRTRYGGVRNPDYRFITRAAQPSLRQMVPGFGTPTENANAVANKAAATMLRAGSSLDNPIMAGLGFRFQYTLSPGESLNGLWLFQDHTAKGSNLVRQMSTAGRFSTFDGMAGAGQTVAGDAESGARKNYVRLQSSSGSKEHEFYVKDYDHDVVSVDGEACLDPDTLDPVEIVAEIVDESRDWLDLPIDFMTSWNDEFHVQHRRSDDDQESGFRKAYGGALVVSFFDTSTEEEGVGVQVNPVNQAVLQDQRTIQVQNTTGLKAITVRFRSKVNSAYMVDVPILILVVQSECEACQAPMSEPCTDLYLTAGTPLPAGLPGVASTPEVQVVAGTTGAPLASPLLIVTIRGAMVGGTPILRVRKLAWVPSAPALAGARMVETGSDEDYYPLVQDSTTPATVSPYGDPHRYTVAFSIAALNAENVAFLAITLVDGDAISAPITVPGPKARAVGLMPIGGTGGGVVCGLY